MRGRNSFTKGKMNILKRVKMREIIIKTKKEIMGLDKSRNSAIEHDRSFSNSN